MMIAPECPECGQPMTQFRPYAWSCPDAHVTTVSDQMQERLDGLFRVIPDTRDLFTRSFSGAQHPEASDEWNADLYADDLGVDLHRIHVYLATQEQLACTNDPVPAAAPSPPTLPRTSGTAAPARPNTCGSTGNTTGTA